MGHIGMRSALVAGAIALAIGVGAGLIFASQQTGPAHAQGGEVELDGIIEVLPATGAVGTWQVSGRTVTVTEQTEIDDEGQTLAPGLRVEIDGIQHPDGSILAEEIEVREADDDDDGGPSAGSSDDDDDGGTVPGPGAPAASDDDDDGPSASSGDDDDGPSTPNSAPSSQADDDD
jgi:hypothetical protein